MASTPTITYFAKGSFRFRTGNAVRETVGNNESGWRNCFLPRDLACLFRRIPIFREALRPLIITLSKGQKQSKTGAIQESLATGPLPPGPLRYELGYSNLWLIVVA